MSAWFKKQPPAIDLDPTLTPEADAFLERATAAFNDKQAELDERWRFGEAAEWGFDQDTGVLWLAFDGGGRFEADGQILGSLSAAHGSWEWAWDNPNVVEAMAQGSRAVKELGERFGIAYLTAGSLPIPGSEFASYLCAIGLEATGSIGVYDADAGNGLSIMVMLKNPRSLPAAPQEL